MYTESFSMFVMKYRMFRNIFMIQDVTFKKQYVRKNKVMGIIKTASLKTT